MKKSFTYICSIVLSVLLVFGLLASTASVVAKINVNETRFRRIAADNNVSQMVYSELEKYFSERYNATGIPAEVYMDAIDTEYLEWVINDTIGQGFYALRDKTTVQPSVQNSSLDDSIDEFFNSYADSINYEKDDKFDQKLSSAKTVAYSIIWEYCDIYKFKALSKHGVLGKLDDIYSRLDLIVAISVGASLLLIIALFLLNLKSKKETLYWTGVSAFISGLIGIVPCVYLLATDYFSAFTIKQPQIYTAYTETMSILTKAFLSASIAMGVLGICLVIVYSVFSGRHKTVKPTSI